MACPTSLSYKFFTLNVRPIRSFQKLTWNGMPSILSPKWLPWNEMPHHSFFQVTSLEWHAPAFFLPSDLLGMTNKFFHFFPMSYLKCHFPQVIPPNDLLRMSDLSIHSFQWHTILSSKRLTWNDVFRRTGERGIWRYREWEGGRCSSATPRCSAAASWWSWQTPGGNVIKLFFSFS